MNMRNTGLSLLTSDARDTEEATITNMMKTSNSGNVTIEWMAARNEFSLKNNIW